MGEDTLERIEVAKTPMPTTSRNVADTKSPNIKSSLEDVETLFDKGFRLHSLLDAVIKCPDIGSQGQMERRFKVSRGAQSAILSGFTKTPSLLTLRRIARAIEVSSVRWKGHPIKFNLLEIQYLCQLCEAAAGEPRKVTPINDDQINSTRLLTCLEGADAAIEKKRTRRARALIQDAMILLKKLDVGGKSQDGKPEMSKFIYDLEASFRDNSRRLLKVEILKYMGERGIQRNRLGELAAELFESPRLIALAAEEIDFFLETLEWGDANLFASIFSRLAMILPTEEPCGSPEGLFRLIGISDPKPVSGEPTQNPS